MKIIQYQWRSSRTTVGIVLCILDDETLQAYIGATKVSLLGATNTEEEDAKLIADYGARLNREEAAAFFPDYAEAINKNYSR